MFEILEMPVFGFLGLPKDGVIKTINRRQYIFSYPLIIMCFYSLSGCPRASANKKRARFPGDDYISKKFRASDGKIKYNLLLFFSPHYVHFVLFINICIYFSIPSVSWQWWRHKQLNKEINELNESNSEMEADMANLHTQVCFTNAYEEFRCKSL